MGGRGSSSGMNAQTPTPLQPPVTRIVLQAQQQPPQQPPQPTPIPAQPPTDDNTPVADDAALDLRTWSDDALAQAVIASRTVQMPNMLSDADDATQKFIYQIGANGKPDVLDDAAFSKFMSDNNIPRSQILSRSVSDLTYRNNDGTQIKMSADRISRMLKYSRFNYIGGKHGGQAYGAGTYFDMNGGGSTGYGRQTINAVLNPATARVISSNQLRVMAQRFAKTHPKFAQAVGPYNSNFGGGKNNMSIYAMAMGYNVITSGSGYHNVIDRRAIVLRRDDR